MQNLQAINVISQNFTKKNKLNKQEYKVGENKLWHNIILKY